MATMTMADIIGEKKERELRGTVYADALLSETLGALIQDCQENPVEPTPVVRVIKARKPKPEPRGRGWRRASGRLK